MSNDIADRLAVTDLIHRYSDGITRRDFATVGTLFAPNAVWEAGAPFTMRLEGPAIIATLSEVLAPFEGLMQMAVNSVIELKGDRATARTIIYEMGNLAPGAVSAFGPFKQYGLYEDVMERIGGRWLFVSRFFHTLYREDAPHTGGMFKLQLNS
jgi:hypothetical protein